MFVNAYPSPAKPSPGQSVTVHAATTSPLAVVISPLKLLALMVFLTVKLLQRTQACLVSIPGAESVVDVVTDYNLAQTGKHTQLLMRFLILKSQYD